MTDLPLSPPPGELVPDKGWRRTLRHPVARMFIGSLAIALSLAVNFALVEALCPKDMRVAWPNIIAALACMLGYWAYVRRIEQRQVIELGRSGALAEWVRGATLGTLLGLLTLGPLGALGVYHIEGFAGPFRES